VYIIRPKAIVVVAVTHTRRSPKYWHSQLH
jgi:hypothetical protein